MQTWAFVVEPEVWCGQSKRQEQRLSHSDNGSKATRRQNRRYSTKIELYSLLWSQARLHIAWQRQLLPSTGQDMVNQCSGRNQDSSSQVWNIRIPWAIGIFPLRKRTRCHHNKWPNSYHLMPNRTSMSLSRVWPRYSLDWWTYCASRQTWCRFCFCFCQPFEWQLVERFSAQWTWFYSPRACG